MDKIFNWSFGLTDLCVSSGAVWEEWTFLPRSPFCLMCVCVVIRGRDCEECCWSG